PTYDLQPEMSAPQLTDELVKAIESKRFDLIVCNYANGDMVGHTGDLEAAIVAVEVVDLCLRRLVAQTRARRGILMVTADHGNADQMFDQKSDGSLHARTSHSLNRVPLVIYDPRLPNFGPRLRPPADAGLTHLAATSLELLGFSAPEHFRPSLFAPTT
ncbi:MAG: 2,3-bisphosphoglycerate-independent phosphoglycerate mutase, partial [Nannocystaceae bacterium]